MEDDLFDFVEKTVGNNVTTEAKEKEGLREQCVEGENNKDMFKDIPQDKVQEMATRVTAIKETIMKHIKELEDENMRLKGELNEAIATSCPSCNHINGEYPKNEKQVEGFIYVDGKTLRLKFGDSNEMKTYYYNNKLHLFDEST